MIVPHGGIRYIIGKVTVPTGLGGVSGVIEVLVTDQSVPPLLPSGLTLGTKALIDGDDLKVTWRTLKAESQMRSAETRRTQTVRWC